MLTEARRVKEAVYFDERVTFELVPPEDVRRFTQRIQGKQASLDLDAAMLKGILERHGLYSLLDQCVDEVVGSNAVDAVLMVGGSTLLPGVYSRLETRFGRDRVRAWHPFEA